MDCHILGNTNQKSVATSGKETTQQVFYTTKEERDLLEFGLKEFEIETPEVPNAELISDYRHLSDISDLSNQEIQINPELQSVNHGFGLVTITANNQHLLNSRPSQRRQGYEIGQQCSQIPSNDNKINNYDIVMQMKVPNILETTNSQGAFLSQVNRKTDEAFPLNSRFIHGYQDFGMLGGSTNHSGPNAIVTSDKIHAPNRKINGIIAENSQASRRSRHEICGNTDQVLSPWNIQEKMNYYFAMDKSATPGQMAFENTSLAGNYHEFSNVKGQLCHNQGMQELYNLSKTTESNINIFLSPENGNIPSEMFYSGRCKDIHSDYDILAIPGSSWMHQKQFASNLCPEKVQYNSPIELQCVELEKEMLICEFCFNKITKHVVSYQGNVLYKCCRCNFKSDKKNHLLMHIDGNKLKHFYCDVCKEVFMKTNLHYGDQMCKTCHKKFLCRGLLEQHSVDHEDHYISFCRVCSRDI